MLAGDGTHICSYEHIPLVNEQYGYFHRVPYFPPQKSGRFTLEKRNKCTAMKMRDLDSSSLAAAGYDASHQQLDIAFRHGGLYRYFGVTRRTYRALIHADSKGQFFTGRIRGHYRFEKLDGA